VEQEDIVRCRRDFGFFAFQGMLRVFNIRLKKSKIYEHFLMHLKKVVIGSVCGIIAA